MKKILLTFCSFLALLLAFPVGALAQVGLKPSPTILAPAAQLKGLLPTCKQSLDAMIQETFSQTWVYRSDAEAFFKTYFDTCPSSSFNTGSLDTPECHEAKSDLSENLFQAAWNYFSERCQLEPNAENPAHDIINCADYIKTTLAGHPNFKPSVLGIATYEADQLKTTDPLYKDLTSRIQSTQTTCNCGNGIKETYEECDASTAKSGGDVWSNELSVSTSSTNPALNLPCTSSCKYLSLPSLLGKIKMAPAKPFDFPDLTAR